jgi:serine phosphatase RsbU (regulator of sigma subunit)
MLFANNDGVLSFDGFSWENIDLANYSKVYSLATSAKGVVYVGGESELGYLKIDESGKTKYTSLVEFIKKEERDFLDVFDIVCSGENVYFLSAEKLMVYNGQSIQTFSPSRDGFFRALYKAGKRSFLVDSKSGLLEIIGNRPVKVPNTEIYGEERIKGIIDLDGQLIACTGNNEFVDLFKTTPINRKWSRLPEENGLIVRNVLLLSNGNICVSSKNDGLIIFNTEGEIVAKYNSENGLVNNSVWYLFEDKLNNLWVATDRGLSYLELSAKINRINEKVLSEININHLCYFNQDLYISTNQSIVKLKKDRNNLTLKKFDFPTITYSQIVPYVDENGTTTLVAATSAGIAEIKNERLEMIDPEFEGNFYLMYPSKHQKGWLVAAEPGLIIVYRKSGNQWLVEEEFDLPGEYVTTIVEPNNNTLWLGCKSNYYFEIKPNSKTGKFEIKKEEMPAQLRFSSGTNFFDLFGKIFIQTQKGLFYYDGKRWLKDTSIQSLPQDSTFEIKGVFPNHKGGYWMSAFCDEYINSGAIMPGQIGGIYNWDDKFLKRLYHIQIIGFEQVGNDLWLATNDGLFVCDISSKSTGNYNFNVLIKKVNLHAEPKNLHSSRWGIGYINDEKIEKNRKISYADNKIRFDYTATSYFDPEKIKFCSQLYPFEKEFTAWTTERTREFTNLPEGKYRFTVRALDIYGNAGDEDHFEFTILPPWYRTWPAYILFAALGIGMVYALVKYNTRRLKMQNIILEETVKVRTAEIEEQKEKIEDINREITDSIRYAQMIQNSILPLDTDLKNKIPHSFIFYRPRNIVSGDFYWVHTFQDQNRILVAAADCTGHGVPGAFMSMMGMEKLNQSTKEFDGISPGKILSFLNKEIKLTLGKHQTASDLKDGMEIVLCDIDLNNNTVVYAGANRPLWFVNKSEEGWSIEALKPTKAGIAGTTDFHQQFEETKRQLKKGDVFYLFTDGATDQFGGPKGKKLMSAGLKELFIHLQSLPVTEHKSYIENYFSDWQGEQEQVDDILIIGIGM